MRLKWYAALAAGVFVGTAGAEVKPHAIFSDNMVLQQGPKAPVWGTATGDAKVVVKFKGKEATGSAANGEWKVDLKDLAADKTPADLVIEADENGTKTTTTFKNVLVGDVWVCSGQSNMEWTLDKAFDKDRHIAASKQPNIRLFTVAKRTSDKPEKTFGKGGPNDHKWLECTPETTPKFSAVGYFFGQALAKALPDTPIGLIHTSWGGTPAQAWTTKEKLDSIPELKYYHADLAKAVAAYDPAKMEEKYVKDMAKHKEDQKAFQAKQKEAKDAGKELPKNGPRQPQKPVLPSLSPNAPSSLYNGMIHPLLPYAVKGAIWYQGESNAGKPIEYRTLFTAMIEDWRKAWNSELPFFCVQLAPYQKIEEQPTDPNWAYLREAQVYATKKLPKVGIAVITDVGEEFDIHPTKKQPVGERLAKAALAMAYGKPVESSGPAFKALRIDGKKAILGFDHIGGGLVCKGDKLTGFTICGADRKFHNADARIEGETVVVTCDKVDMPVAVRFGWANFPVVNFWNKDGLPASPFRTDEFAYPSAPAKK